MRWILVGVLVALGVGVGAPAVADTEIEIEVAEAPDADRWRVTYRFAEPLRGVVFQRPRSVSRSRSWRLAGDGLRWGVLDGRDAILVEDSPVRELELRFASEYQALAKGYELNVSYTDGGRLLYSGDLSVQPLDAARADHRWRFRTTDGRHIVVLDRSGTGTLEWLEAAGHAGNGTYVYFGPSRPRVEDRVSYLADPGLPGWMRREIEALLPRLFDRYAEITGVELDFHPLVLLSYSEGESTGLTFMGGTLDGLVQIHAAGRAWRQPSAEATRMWFDRTAHEAFHLWTGQMFTTSLEGPEEWLTEGGADYYGLYAALDAGLLERAAYRRRLVDRANACLTGLGNRPLLDPVGSGDFGNLYVCGSTLWLWASEAARQAAEDHGEHAFVRALLERAEDRDRQLTTYRFLETLHVVTAGPRQGAQLARLLFVGAPEGRAEYFVRQMRAAGLDVELVPIARGAGDGATAPAPADTPRSRTLRLREK